MGGKEGGWEHGWDGAQRGEVGGIWIVVGRAALRPERALENGEEQPQRGHLSSEWPEPGPRARGEEEPLAPLPRDDGLPQRQRPQAPSARACVCPPTCVWTSECGFDVFSSKPWGSAGAWPLASERLAAFPFSSGVGLCVGCEVAAFLRAEGKVEGGQMSGRPLLV